MFEDPTFWVAAAFFIFVGGVAKPAFTAVTGQLDQRSEQIRNDIEEARRLRDEAQTILAEFREKQSTAMKDAEDILTQAESDAQRLKTETEQSLETTLSEREALALERIRRAENRVKAEVRDMAVDIAIETTRKLLAESLDAKGHADLIHKAAVELPEKLH